MNEDLQRIKTTFDQKWESWEIELPQEDLDERRAGVLRQQNGSGMIRYTFGSIEGRPYLEYYSFHRIGGDSHARIHPSGETEYLETLQTMYIVSDDPADTEK